MNSPIRHQSSDAYGEQLVRPVLVEMFEEHTVTEILNSDAFGALVYRVRQHCHVTGDQVADVFRALDDHHLDFAPDADDPAAFLAAKIRDLSA